MQRTEIVRRLTAFGAAITKQVAFPNHGGCGVIAALAGSALQNHGVECDIVTPVYKRNRWVKPAAEVRRVVPLYCTDIREWDENGLSRSHLALRFKSGSAVWTWDSDGVVRAPHLFGHVLYPTEAKFRTGLTVAEAWAISIDCDDLRAWNTTFDRRQIPLLFDLCREHLGEP